MLGVQDGWKTTVSILSHVIPPIFKSEIGNDVTIKLVPNARGNHVRHSLKRFWGLVMLDKHTWTNGYSPSQATAMASTSGTMADFEAQADDDEGSESSVYYDSILPELMGVPENVALIVTIGSIVFELCRRNGKNSDCLTLKLTQNIAETANNSGIRLDVYERKLPKVFPEVLAEHCTPVELAQVLKLYFEDAFEVEFGKPSAILSAFVQ